MSRLFAILRDDSLCKKLEVDLLDPRCGGVDLRDFYRGKISVRRLATIVSELPADSRVIIELRHRGAGHDDPLWDQNTYLLADIFDVANHHRWLYQSYLAATAGQKTMPEPPERYPRPGWKPSVEEKPKFASAQELTEMFGP